MAVHTEDALRSARISEIFDLSFTVATLEAVGTEGLVSGQDGQILDLVAAAAATVGTVVADERPVAEEEQVRVRVEESATSVASKAINVPSVPGYQSQQVGLVEALSGSPTKLERLPLFQDLQSASANGPSGSLLRATYLATALAWVRRILAVIW